MGELTSDVFRESCCDGGACGSYESARGCGCDPGCKPKPHVCDQHQTNFVTAWDGRDVLHVVEREQEALEHDNRIKRKEGAHVASREAVENEGKDFGNRSWKKGVYESAEREHRGIGSSPAEQQKSSHPRDIAAGNNPVQTGFATGATRSTSDGKIDYEGHLNPDVLAVFGEFMNEHRVQRDGQLRASDNWQQGIPVYRYVKSLIRHTFEFWRMWRGTPVVNLDNGKLFTFRDVLGAVLFNAMGIIHEALGKYPGFLDSHSIPRWQREQFESEDTRQKTPMPPTRKEANDAAKPEGQCSTAADEPYACAYTNVHKEYDGGKGIDLTGPVNACTIDSIEQDIRGAQTAYDAAKRQMKEEEAARFNQAHAGAAAPEDPPQTYLLIRVEK